VKGILLIYVLGADVQVMLILHQGPSLPHLSVNAPDLVCHLLLKKLIINERDPAD
jgi:hypothetical protein